MIYVSKLSCVPCILTLTVAIGTKNCLVAYIKPTPTRELGWNLGPPLTTAPLDKEQLNY